MSNSNNRIYFKIIAILLSLFLFVIVEFSLRLFSYGTNMHLFVKHSVEQYEDYYRVNPLVGEKYFNRFEATSGTNDIFLKHKPDNGYRIFVMGSSSLYGFPYDKNLMASRILHKRLQDAYPDKNIEVINTASTAINSITLKDYIKQILQHDPDAILFYAGHNEYYGAFGVGSNETMSKSSFLRATHFKLINLRVYQLVRSIINGITKQVTSKPEADTKETLMKGIVKDKDIVYKGAKYKIGIHQFQSNLSYILKEAKNNDIPVFLSDLVSNIKDLPPFGDIAEENLSAKITYREAIWTLSGGDTLLAKDLFYRAKDLDPIRFRASEEINLIIDSLADQSGIFFIPAKEWFSNASDGGLIGNNLLTEHVHPNIEGQFVLADAFYTTIVESGLIEAVPNPLTTRTRDYYRRNWGFTNLDSLVGIYKIEQLKSYWPFNSLDTEVSFRDTFKTSGLVDSLAFTVLTNPDTDLESLHDLLGDLYDNNKQLLLACKEYEALIRINPYRSDYYNKAANCLLKLNDLYAAEKYLKKSVTYVETNYAYSLLGEIEYIKHNYNGAIDAYKSALELDDKDHIETENRSVLLSQLYEIYYLIKDVDNMNYIQNELSEIGLAGAEPSQSHEFEYSKYVPSNIELNFNKAQHHFNTNIDSSLYYLSLCLETNDCPLVNMFIGNILYQKQDKGVLYYYNKAYDGYSKDPSFLLNLFVANLVNNDKPRARVVLDELIEIDPLFSEIPKLEAILKN